MNEEDAIKNGQTELGNIFFMDNQLFQCLYPYETRGIFINQYTSLVGLNATHLYINKRSWSIKYFLKSVVGYEIHTHVGFAFQLKIFDNCISIHRYIESDKEKIAGYLELFEKIYNEYNQLNGPPQKNNFSIN